MIEDEKYFMGRDILNQCYSYNQLYYFYRELGLKGIDRYINELQNESKSKSREIERLRSIIKEVREYIEENQEEHKFTDRGGFTYTEGHFLRDSDRLLEILDKTN